MDYNAIYAAEIELTTSRLNRDNITNYDTDDLITHIENAWRAIASYLWIPFNDYEQKADFTRLISLLAVAYINNDLITSQLLQGEEQIIQKSQSGRSVTYRSTIIEIDNNGLTGEVKAALPPRKLRVI